MAPPFDNGRGDMPGADETDRVVHVKAFRAEAASFLDKQRRLL